MADPWLVSFTDYILALECFYFGWSTRRDKPVLLFFLGVGTAALCGGAVHGIGEFALGKLYPVLWKMTLLSVGTAATAFLALGSRWFFPRISLRTFAMFFFIPYSIVILFVRDEFSIAILGYLPALFYFGFSQFRRLKNNRLRAIQCSSATGLILLSSFLQIKHVSIGAIDHNSLYHFIQMVAMYLAWKGLSSD